MKKIFLFLWVAIAGCGAKTNEDIAKDLIKEHLKATLPDFNNYDAVNYGTMGKAFLPYEETAQYTSETKTLNVLKDSVSKLEQAIKTGPATGGGTLPDKKRLQQLQDNIKAEYDSINSGKRSYVPVQLFKLTHAYKVKDNNGIEKTTEEAYYFDNDFKKIVKVEKVN